jgi:hypothetical protein
MGRTLPTATLLIQNEEASWSKFRKALRKEDQDILDKLFRDAKLQLPAISMEARPIPFESIALSMMIGLYREILDLRNELQQA